MRKLSTVLKTRRNIISRYLDFKWIIQQPFPQVLKILKKREEIKRKRLLKKYPNSYKSTSITIEGLDGVGKATTIKEIERLLESEHCRSSVIIDYPNYKSWTSILVRMYLQGKIRKDPNKISSKTASAFYAIDRWLDYHFRVKKHIRNGVVILYDRYTSSNMLFQGAKLINTFKKNSSKESKENSNKLANLEKWILCLESVFFGIPFCDSVNVLYMTKSQYMALVLSENFKNKHNSNKDIHENSEFLLSILEHQEKISKLCGWQLVYIATDNKYDYLSNKLCFHNRVSPENIAKEILKRNL